MVVTISASHGNLTGRSSRPIIIGDFELFFVLNKISLGYWPVLALEQQVDRNQIVL
jgi:hypothetical protein